MKISAKDVDHVAYLAKLRFEEVELERFTHQLNDILAYVDKLNELDTTATPPTSHAMELFNVLREDVVAPSLRTEKALSNAPDSYRNCFRVPRIIE